MSNVFSGAKIAVLGAGQVLAVQRDHAPGIPYPRMWDLPGGGREFGETPLDCALRETFEETGLRVVAADVVSEREYRNPLTPLLTTWFLVARSGWLVLPTPRLGSEGRAVRWMPIEAFLTLEDAIPHLQDRLRDYLGGGAVRAAE